MINVYRKLLNSLKTIYFVPLEGGWLSITVSVIGSLVLCPVVFVLILFTYIVKVLDILWVKLSYLCCNEKHLLFEPLNDLDYLMWRTRRFGQPLIMCFFAVDHIEIDSIVENLIYRIENKDAFRGVRNTERQINFFRYKENKRLFCKVDKSLGRLWYKFMEGEYNIRKNIIKLNPYQTRYLIKNPHLVLDNDLDENLEERLKTFEYKEYKINSSNEKLSESETIDFYSMLYSCEKGQLSLKRPCWRIIVLDNVNWKGTTSSVVIGQFHHVIGDGSTLTELINKTILDFPDTITKENSKPINGVTKSAAFWHRWISGLVWAAIAGPITLIKAALQARPERSWDSPNKIRPKRSKNVRSLGPINLQLSEINLLKDKLNHSFFSLNETNPSSNMEISTLSNRKTGYNEFTNGVRKRGTVFPDNYNLNEIHSEINAKNNNRNNNLEGENRTKFSKRITFNDIILSCIASGYTKYVNHYLSLNDLDKTLSQNSTEISTPTSLRRSIDENLESEQIYKQRSSITPSKNNLNSREISLTSPIHFDDKSPYSSVLKYDSISEIYDLDGILDSKKGFRRNSSSNSQSTEFSSGKRILDEKYNSVSSNEKPIKGFEIIEKIYDAILFGFSGIGSTNRSKDTNDLANICHSNLNVVVTTNNRTDLPEKLDNAFSIIVLPIPTCPKVSPSERLRCVFESLQEYRNTSLPIIFIRYIKYTLSVSPFLLLLLWIPHSSSCSIYYSSVPGPKECTFMNKGIKDMTFGLPLTDNIGLGVSIFTFENKVSISITYDEDIIINPRLFLETIKQSFNELKFGAFNCT
ncbi:hypothetical protein FG386_000554 [Cryptosporidium ryanae]|uniref:uncharacterized protein n=1 Tax=Cryptosporidium ryanae TaxID=515981 RepID=UPI00351A5C31|nr:hypothetical protein FG386_000554 [Cryptosporidium ryanae]